MRIYLSSSWQRRAEMRIYAVRLGVIGHIVTSRWINVGQHEDKEDILEHSKVASLYADDDLADINRCDMFIQFTSCGQYSRGGHHVELGYAIALGCEIVIIGQCQNIFHMIDDIMVYENFEDFVEDYLEAQSKAIRKSRSARTIRR